MPVSFEGLEKETVSFEGLEKAEVQDIDFGGLDVDESYLRDPDGNFMTRTSNFLKNNSLSLLSSIQSTVAGVGGVMEIAGQASKGINPQVPLNVAFNGLGTKLKIGKMAANAIRERYDKEGYDKEQASKRIGSITSDRSMGALMAKFGRTIEDYGDKEAEILSRFRDQEIYKGDFLENPSWTRGVSAVLGAIPSLGMAWFATMLTGNPALAGTFLGLVEAEDTYDKALAESKDPTEALLMFGQTAAGIAGLETFSLGTIQKSGVMGKVAAFLVGGGTEGLTEGGQQLYQNMISKYGIDYTTKLWSGVAESVIAGAVSGGAISSLNHATMTDKIKNEGKAKGLTDEEIDQVISVVTENAERNADEINDVIVDNMEAKAKAMQDIELQKKAQEAYDEKKPKVVEELKPLEEFDETERPLIEEARKYKTAEEFVEENIGLKNKDYGMQHRPTFTGATADNVTQEVSEMGLPKDFYNHPEYYLSGNEIADKQSLSALRKARNNPEAEVTIYRASPKNELNTGDWVTLSKEYAKGEALDEGVDIHSFKVKAKDIHFAGDDINEFGYYPAQEVQQLTDIWNKAQEMRAVEVGEPEPLDNAIYEQNREAKKTFTKKGIVKQTIADARIFGDKTFVPISTRAKKMSNRIREAIRKYSYNMNKNEFKFKEKAKPFMDKVSEMEENDYYDLDLALKNQDIAKVDELLNKYDMQEDFTKVKTLLDDIYNKAKDAGLDINYLEEYFPHQINNYEDFMSYIKQNENWSSIEDALSRIDPDGLMSFEERAIVVNKLIRGLSIKGIQLFKPGFAKTRTIENITPALNQFYTESPAALVNYIESMNKAIEIRKFLGKGEDIENSIGWFVDEQVRLGNLQASQEKELRDMLQALIQERGTHGIIQTAKNSAYIYTMGSPISAITQIGDLALSMYKNGFWNTAKGFKTSFTPQNITKEDIYIDKIMQEFKDPSNSAKAVEWVFNAIGLSSFDNAFKSTTINAAFDKFQKLARKNDAKFNDMVSEIFEDEAPQTIDDLKNGVLSDNVRYMLFSNLADIQPVSLSEMPEYYLKLGNMRVLYMLKTYTMKMLDIYHNDVGILMQTDPKQALSNLVRLSSFLFLMGMASDAIKDFILQRKTSLEDMVVDNIFKLAGLTKYNIYKARREGLLTSLYTGLLPPLFVPVNDVIKDSIAIATGKKDIQEVWSLGRIPIAGKLYYWWFGGGRKDIKENEDKKKKRRRR